VTANLEVILRQAALVAEIALPDEVEPAPIFQA
jgi:1-carboxybiuret hydrolase subunit AtzG-like protein